MDAHEEFEIYRAFKDSTHKGNILNDQLKFNSNTLYNIAIKNNFRFYSFGDAMFII